MSVPPIILSEIYDLLVTYDESPKMTKKTFTGWFSNGYIYDFQIELRTLIFACDKPFSCHVIRAPDLQLDIQKISDEDLIIINTKLNDFSCRIERMVAFW